MGPIADAVSYTINEDPNTLDNYWVHNIMLNAMRKACIRQSGYHQHLKESKLMLELTKQNEQPKA